MFYKKFRTAEIFSPSQEAMLHPDGINQIMPVSPGLLKIQINV